MMRWCTVLLAIFYLAAASDAARSRVRRIVGGSPAQVPPQVDSSATEAPTPTPSPITGSTSAPTTAGTPPPTTAGTTPPTPAATPGPTAANTPAPTGASTPPPTTGSPTVQVRDKRSAVVNGLQNPDGTYSFLGIRYAEPPVKKSRFLRPRRLKLKGVINAKRYGPPCPQFFRGKLVGKEDCLYLNVHTPKVPTGDGPPPSYPVLVWIHGGNFQRGSAAQYSPAEIVRKGVVVVTLQYRLGSLGFLSLGRKELPGNVGLFDISLATRWVKDYIKFFGGNPRRIIPSGQGSGASCASFLAFNRMLKNSIRGLFTMSGTPVSPFTMDEGETRTANEVAEVDGCYDKKETDFIRCMQALPIENIMKGDSGIQTNREQRYTYAQKMSNLLVPGPVEEGKDDSRFLPNYLTESPLESLQKGNFPKIPLLTGVTKQETGNGVRGNFLQEISKLLLNPSFLKGDIFKDLLNANIGLYEKKAVNPSLAKLFDSSEYIKFFSNIVSSVLNEIGQVVQHSTDAFFALPLFVTTQMWSQKNKAYVYSFDHSGKSNAARFLEGNVLAGPESAAASEPGHGDDLSYLFDFRTLEGEPITSGELSEADKKVRDHFTTMVAEFARTGTPKTADGQTWAPFTKEDGSYMSIDEKPSLLKGFRKCAMGLWTGDNNILSSTECALGEASKIVTDTLGAAGTRLVTSINDFQGRVGDTVNALSQSANASLNQVGQTLGNLTPVNPALNLGNINSGNIGGGSLLGLGGQKNTGPTTSKPANQGSPLNLGGGGGSSLLGLGGQKNTGPTTSKPANQGSPLNLGGGGGSSFLGLGGQKTTGVPQTPTTSKPANQGSLLGLGGQKQNNKGGFLGIG